MTHTGKQQNPRPTGPVILRPVTGLPKFRKNVSLRFDGSAIVVTDRRGRSRTFPLDGTDRAPSDLRVFRVENQGLMDGAGKLLALWENGIWNSKEEVALIAATGLHWGMHDLPELPPMRDDGIRMYDIPTIPMMTGFSSIGVLGFAGLQLHFLPAGLADIVLTGGFVGSVASFVLWRKGSRLDPEVAEGRRQAVREALAETPDDDDQD